MTRLEALGVDPLLRQHLAVHLAAAASGTLAAWDCRWAAAQILAGGWSVIPPVNLVRNRGFGADATRTTYPDDLAAALVVGEAPAVDPARPRPEPDPDYDRLSLLVEIMATYRDPAMVARLARSRQLLVDADGTPDANAVHHLAPFDVPDDAIAVVRHLRDVGVVADSLDELEQALVTAAVRPART
jgi:hypothetical protein